MRFTRAALVSLAGSAGVVAIEGPAGCGKSWLLHSVAPGARRVGPHDLRDAELNGAGDVVVDDAHLLDRAGVAALAAAIVDPERTSRLFVAGRLLDDAVIDATELVGGVAVPASRLTISADEVLDAASDVSEAEAVRLVDAAGGSVRIIARALDQRAYESGADLTAVAGAMARNAASAVLARLSPDDVTDARLLARISPIDRPTLDALGGAGLLDRLVQAGLMVQRGPAGLVLGDLPGHAADHLDPVLADAAASALLARNRPLEAVNLLLDAGQIRRAAAEMAAVPASVIEVAEPRGVIALVDRFGIEADRRPELLLLRAGAHARLGRLDHAGADIDRAAALADSFDPATRRRIAVEVAELSLYRGERDTAISTAEQVLAELQPGEERAYSRACTVLAEAAATFRDREHLQTAAEWYSTAAAAWMSCGESARARSCRCDRVSAALVPLGRFDEALTEIGDLLATADLADVERSWMLAIEGFALFDAGRTLAAAERFARAADLGHLLDNPRIVATAAWGRALVAGRQYDNAGALHAVNAADNTGLGPADDILGVPYLCDIVIALGALGEQTLASEYLARARSRPQLYPERLEQAAFIHGCRLGRPGQLDVTLAHTPPAERWRVELAGAVSCARSGEPRRARQLLADAERSAAILGLGDLAALGERDAVAEVHRNAPQEIAAAPEVPIGAAPARAPSPTGGRRGRRLLVMGGPVRVADGDSVRPVPGGNAQRLVGVVAACGGAASLDVIADAMWPDEDAALGRARLRNVLMRLRRGAGDVLARTAHGVRLAADVTCDVHDFLRMAGDAQSTARTDPDLGGHVAAEALAMVDGDAFVDFEYEEWAHAARKQVGQATLGLLDLLSVQAEDRGDLVEAERLAERALRFEPYSDSRHVRIAELLALQGRHAAAVAVLEEAAAAARAGNDAALPRAVIARRSALLRRATT